MIRLSEKTTVKERIVRVVEKPVEKAKVVYTKVQHDGYNMLAFGGALKDDGV